MPWKATSVLNEKLMLIAACLREEAPITVLWERHGISRQTGYVWWRRYDAAGVADEPGLGARVAAGFAVFFVLGATLDAWVVGATPAAPVVSGWHPVSRAVTAAAVSRAAAPREPITRPPRTDECCGRRCHSISTLTGKSPAVDGRFRKWSDRYGSTPSPGNQLPS